MPVNPRLLVSTYAQRAEPDEVAHDPDRVRLVDQRLNLRGKRYNLVTPFAGKPFFREYLRGLDRLPLRQAHFVAYDNSNSPRFRQQLTAAIAARFDSWTLVEDRNPPVTAERTTDYARISWRCHKLYQDLYERRIERLPLCLNVEDDTELPAGTWERLNTALNLDATIATAVGVQCSRRMADDTACLPMAWNFLQQTTIGGDGAVSVVDQRIVHPKPCGIEPIGAAHMACWLTRTPVIRRLGMAYGWDGINAQDLCWGYALNTSGYRMVIDWSVRTRHYYLAGRKKCFV